MGIVIAVIATFIATFILVVVWQSISNGKTRAIQRIMVTGLVSQLDEMAEKLGYSDYLDYQRKMKGDEYAKTVATNINNLLASFAINGVPSTPSN